MLLCKAEIVSQWSSVVNDVETIFLSWSIISVSVAASGALIMSSVRERAVLASPDDKAATADSSRGVTMEGSRSLSLSEATVESCEAQSVWDDDGIEDCDVIVFLVDPFDLWIASATIFLISFDESRSRTRTL